jgi:hypothetical protein
VGLFLEIGFYLGMRFFEKGCLSLKGHSCKLCVAPSTLRKVSGTSARWHHFDRHLVVPQSSAWPEVVCETKPLEGDPGWQGGWSLQEAHWSLAVFVSQQCLGSAFAKFLIFLFFWTLFPMGWMKVFVFRVEAVRLDIPWPPGHGAEISAAAFPFLKSFLTIIQLLLRSTLAHNFVGGHLRRVSKKHWHYNPCIFIYF